MAVAIGTMETYVTLIYILLCTHNGEGDETSPPRYCPYFQNRAPSPQPSLDNCTWYKENACCLNEELAIIFSNLLPMAGADGKCLEALNHLYCYVCSPEQSRFFARDMLTVCEESCNLIHTKCANALLKGVPWRELYSNGTEFCSARKFRTEKAETRQCFDFTKLLKSFAMSVRGSVVVILCCVLYLAAHSYLHIPCVF
jgi:hypothetical protein